MYCFLRYAVVEDVIVEIGIVYVGCSRIEVVRVRFATVK